MKNITVINLREAHKKGIISKQEYKTLKGQVLSGRERSAVKGFKTILKRKGQGVGEM